jgi:hypothetical protein
MKKKIIIILLVAFLLLGETISLLAAEGTISQENLKVNYESVNTPLDSPPPTLCGEGNGGGNPG